MKWTAILSTEDEAVMQAWEAIDQITQSVVAKNYEGSEEFRASGRGYEEALLYGYLALVHKDEKWADRASVCLNESINQAKSLSQYLGLFGGLAGLGWIIEHVSRALCHNIGDNGADDAAPLSHEDDDDVNAEIDAAILNDLRRAIPSRQYDLIGGLVGLGMYFLERLPRPLASEGLSVVLAQLETLSQKTNQGVTWHTGPELLPEWQRERCPDGYYNLGVAHGIPGVIHFLSELATQSSVLSKRSLTLMEGAVQWLIAQQRPLGSISRFSSWLVSGEENGDSRLAWCYGDLGVLAVLLQVSRRWHQTEWRGYALSLLDHCLAWPLEEAGVVDAPLCHGTAGIAHIFNRIYHAENDPRCLVAARDWFKRTLAFQTTGTGVGGFLHYTRPDLLSPPVWRASPALLDGATGIAIALLAAVSEIEPNWDRILLLSGCVQDIDSKRFNGS